MLFIVGVSHRNSPLEVREALAFPRDGLAEALHRMLSEAGVTEAMILSTCNRVELYLAVEDEHAEVVAAFLWRHHGRDPAQMAASDCSIWAKT